MADRISVRPISRDWVTGLQAAEAEFPQGATYARQYGHRTTLATPLSRLRLMILCTRFVARRRRHQAIGVSPFAHVSSQKIGARARGLARPHRGPAHDAAASCRRRRIAPVPL